MATFNCTCSNSMRQRRVSHHSRFHRQAVEIGPADAAGETDSPTWFRWEDNKFTRLCERGWDLIVIGGVALELTQAN
jgi:hypothetical protein